MSKIRILCTADIHLGRSSAIMGDCPHIDSTSAGAWKRIVDLAISDESDAVVIAGDVFDGRGAYVESKIAFFEGVNKLAAYDIPVIAVAGNHDWDVLPVAARTENPNFHMLGRKGDWETKILETKNGQVCFVGWSFGSEHVSTSQMRLLKRVDQGIPIVGMVHGDISPGSKYHPLVPAEFVELADAWVLGHIHKPMTLHARAVYPGSPQALDFGPGERGVHGIRRLELASGAISFSDVIPLSSVRFDTVKIDVWVEEGRDPFELAMDAVHRKCRELSDNQTFESVQLRAELTFRGIETSPRLEDLGVHTLDNHAFTITSSRALKNIDPWSFKDLRTKEGEAARLLIGVTGFQSNREIPAAWIEAAKQIIERSSVDVDQQYQRTLASVNDRGEAALEPPSETERFSMARQLVIEELEKILQGAAS